MEKAAYYLQIATTTSSIVFAFVFIFYNWNKNLFKKLLSIQFVFLSYGLLISFIAFNNFLTKFPHLSRTGLLCALLIPPIQYLAVSTSLNNQKLQWKDSLHFLPALLYFVNYINYFILSAEKKIVLIENNSIAAYNEGYFPAFLLPILSLIQTTFYLAWFGFFIKKIKKEITSMRIRQFYYFIIIYMVCHYIPILMLLLNYYDSHNITGWMPIIYAFLNFLFFFKILITPDWLFYQINHPSTPKSNSSEKTFIATKKIVALEEILLAKLTPNKTKLFSDEIQLFDRFTTIVEAEQFFLNPSFSQKKVAKKLEVSEYKIRRLIDKTYGVKFSEFTNNRRIYFLLLQMQNNSNWNRYSYVAIAQKLGYLSANSFYMNFKKISGLTPKEYFHSEEESE